MGKFLLTYSSYGEESVIPPEDFENPLFSTQEEVLAGILKDIKGNGYDLEDASSYVVYEVSNTFTYVPPTDNGTLAPRSN